MFSPPELDSGWFVQVKVIKWWHPSNSAMFVSGCQDNPAAHPLNQRFPRQALQAINDGPPAPEGHTDRSSGCALPIRIGPWLVLFGFLFWVPTKSSPILRAQVAQKLVLPKGKPKKFRVAGSFLFSLKTNHKVLLNPKKGAHLSLETRAWARQAQVAERIKIGMLAAWRTSMF